jgi:ketosteroid isomerase-like protein
MLMKTARYAAAFLAALALAACQRSETPEQAMSRMSAEAEAARPAIEAAIASYGRWYSTAQVDSLMTLHAADAHVMGPNMAPAHGTEGVRQFFTQGFSQGALGTLSLRTENLTVNGPVAIERGRWNFTPQEGAPLPPDSGKYLTHWHGSGGTWLISEVIWNSDVPMPAPAPAPARRRG